MHSDGMQVAMIVQERRPLHSPSAAQVNSSRLESWLSNTNLFDLECVFHEITDFNWKLKASSVTKNKVISSRHYKEAKVHSIIFPLESKRPWEGLVPLKAYDLCLECRNAGRKIKWWFHLRDFPGKLISNLPSEFYWGMSALKLLKCCFNAHSHFFQQWFSPSQRNARTW